MDTKTPNWLRKPKHKKEVVATAKGWTVKDTGEVLVSIKNLDAKLSEYFGTAVKVTSEVALNTASIVVDDKTTEEKVVEDTVTEEKVDTVVDEPVKEDTTEEKVVEEPVKETAPSAALVDNLLDSVDPDKKTWINKGEEKKLVRHGDLQSFLDDGWAQGKKAK